MLIRFAGFCQIDESKRESWVLFYFQGDLRHLVSLMFGFIQNLGAMEIFLILLIVLLLFGAKRLPELSRSMGKSLREFKKATSDVEEDFKNAMNEEPAEKKPKSETPIWSSRRLVPR